MMPSGGSKHCSLGNGMTEKVEEIIAKIGSNRQIGDILEEILTGPDDRAYIVCLADDCKKNIKGRCSIHTVQGQRDIPAISRCRDYEA